jgi:cytochrome c oxidase assembly protein Cox11
MPHETVDMPVFFYIDTAFLEDPFMTTANTITLNYTFFRSRSGEPDVMMYPTAPEGSAR